MEGPTGCDLSPAQRSLSCVSTWTLWSSRIDLLPSLAVLVPLLNPTRRHWGRSTVRSRRALWCRRTLVVLLRRVALGLTIALRRLTVALRRPAVLLGRLTILLRWWLTVLLLRRWWWCATAAVVATVVAIREATITRSSTARCRTCIRRVYHLVRSRPRESWACKSSPVGLSLGLSSSSSNSFIFFLRKSMSAMCVTKHFLARCRID